MLNNIEDSFEDKTTAYLFGLGAWAYWFYHFFTPRLAFKILPGVNAFLMACFFALVTGFQIFVWIYFKHFQKKWYFNPRAYLYFASELGILTFTLAFVLWPVFLIFKSKLI